jgi:hypothetical protein
LSIGAIAQGESLDRVQRLSETNDLVEGFPRPVDTESMATSGATVCKRESADPRSLATNA